MCFESVNFALTRVHKRTCNVTRVNGDKNNKKFMKVSVKTHGFR